MPKRKSSSTSEIAAKAHRSSAALHPVQQLQVAPLKFAAPISLGQVHVDKTWPDICLGLKKLIDSFDKGFSVQEWMGLYQIIYETCTSISTNIETLYQNLTRFFVDRAAAVYSQICSFTRVDLIHNYLVQWERFMTATKYLAKLFTYLQRWYIEEQDVRSFEHLLMHAWYEHVLKPLRRKIFDVLIALFAAERAGDTVQRSLIRNMMQSYVRIGAMNATKPQLLKPTVSLQVYQELFETEYIDFISESLALQARGVLVISGISSFLQCAHTGLADERSRAAMYLEESTERKLHAACVQQLVAGSEGILQSGFQYLLSSNQLDDVERMYSIVSHPVAAVIIPRLAELLKSHVFGLGNALLQQFRERVQSPRDLDEFFKPLMDDLLELHSSMTELIERRLGSNDVFSASLEQAFRLLSNEKLNDYQMAQLLALYVDRITRVQAKITDDELEHGFDTVMRLFTYVDDKDVFFEYHRRMLCKRLLSTQANEDNERNFISRLKQVCGQTWTSKLEGMVNDTRLNTDLMTKFRDSAGFSALPFEFTTHVLNSGNWPISGSDLQQFLLPADLAVCVDVFNKFYAKHQEAHKLTWCHSLGSAVVRCNFSGRFAVEVFVSTLQATILLLFNDTSKPFLTLADIAGLLGCETITVDRAIEPLCCGKHHVLLRTSVAESEDRFSTNLAIASQKPPRRLIIPATRHAITTSEQSAASSTVETNRRYQIDAVIVRTMKGRKMLQHATLMAEVTAVLLRFFKPDPREVKKRIESLIEREFLERDKHDPTLYMYIA
eukprot:TRINITY_DN11411_c0_g1_i1.p1 TRINITY_DN11411_c0_g1~~TRINITY_DN11411_c0_g1_i1.p1  ORF type:complete len:781 (+),score=118.98 TRINITY_DN11411_c0_g1_i1:69-2411(+)